MKNGIARRDFLRTGGGIAAGAAGVVTQLADADAAKPAAERHAGATVLPYGRKVIARAKQLAPGVPVRFAFPDEASPCVVIKNGRPVPGGVGPMTIAMLLSNTVQSWRAHRARA